MIIKLIIGLRNPGQQYANTRHNAGAWFAQALCQNEHGHFQIDKKFQGEMAQLSIHEQACAVFMPLTYMNQSGLPVRALSQFYKIQPQEILVAHDDLDLAVGRVQLKSGGGHAGHNGLRDLIAHLGSNEFHRLRIGIGHPGQKALVHDYVLGKPSLSDKQSIMQAIDGILAVMPKVLLCEFSEAMNDLKRS